MQPARQIYSAGCLPPLCTTLAFDLQTMQFSLKRGGKRRFGLVALGASKLVIISIVYREELKLGWSE